MLAINDQPVAIEQIEMAIAERAFQEGWVVPEPPGRVPRRGRQSRSWAPDPARLAVAAEAQPRRPRSVIVYERDEGPGGLMRFEVPDAKLEKAIIDRRVAILLSWKASSSSTTSTSAATSTPANNIETAMPSW